MVVDGAPAVGVLEGSAADGSCGAVAVEVPLAKGEVASLCVLLEVC